MRVLLIRQTETESNVGMQGEGFLLQKKQITAAELEEYTDLRHNPKKRDFDARPLSDLQRIGEDVPTKTGVEMTLALAGYWAPVLAPFVERGKVEFVVSPTFRTQLTVDPLIRALKQRGEFPCTLMPELCELPSPNHVKDQAVKAPIQRLLYQAERAANAAEGQRLRDEAIALLEVAEANGWTPAGMTGRQITETGIDLRGELVSFPWAELPDDWPMDDGWCVFGPEMELEATGVRPTTRFKDVHNWLDELRQEKALNDILVLVAHGGSIARIINELMSDASSRYSYSNHDNTSVCSIMMYPDTEQLAAVRITCNP